MQRTRNIIIIIIIIIINNNNNSNNFCWIQRGRGRTEKWI